MRHIQTMLLVLALLAAVGTACAETMVAALGNGPKSRTFDAKPVFEPRSVLVVGDSLSIYLGERIEEAFRSKPDVAVSRLSKVSSGLAVPSFFNWNEQLQNLASRNKPDLVLLMLGANDNKPLRDAGGRPLIFGGPAWSAEYGARAQKLIDICREHNPNARIFWIGAPVMAKAQFDRELQHINEVIRAQCALNQGVFFVNTRDVLADASGDFTKTLTNAAGKEVRVRADDGVHITPTGAALLAQRSLDAVAANGGAVIHGLPQLKEPIRIAPLAQNGETVKMRQVQPALKGEKAAETARGAAKSAPQDSNLETAALPLRQVKPQIAPQPQQELASNVPMRQVKPQPLPEAVAATQSAPEPEPKTTATLPMRQVKPQQQTEQAATPLLVAATQPQKQENYQPVSGTLIATQPYEIRVKMRQVKPLPERELAPALQAEAAPAPATPSVPGVLKETAQAEAAPQAIEETPAQEPLIAQAPEQAPEELQTQTQKQNRPEAQPRVAAADPKLERLAARVLRVKETPAAAPKAEHSASSGYAIQESAWENNVLAEKHAQELQKKGLTARVVTVDLGAKGVWRRVLIGECDNEAKAQALQQELQQRYNLKNTLIRKLG